MVLFKHAQRTVLKKKHEIKKKLLKHPFLCKIVEEEFVQILETVYLIGLKRALI